MKKIGYREQGILFQVEETPQTEVLKLGQHLVNKEKNVLTWWQGRRHVKDLDYYFSML